MRTLFTLVLATIALFSFSQTPTIRAVTNNGLWGDAATWNPARVPQDGDVVEITAGFTVVVKQNVYNNTTPKPNLTIQINGILQFEPSGELRLGTISIIQLYNSSAQITSTTNSSSELIYIGSVLKYEASKNQTLSGPAFANSATAPSPSGFSVGILPIKLRSFSAQPQGNRIALNWTTDEELNTSHFVIERSSNARTWAPIQSVVAKGEAAGYTTTDGAPAAGDNFYRLKSVDLDGKFQYSHVLKVARGRSLAVHVSPNPASEQVTVSLSGPSTAPVQLQLVNNNGQVVSEKLYAAGTSLIQFDLKSAAPGVYTLLLRNGNTLMETTQLLIK